ncbi:MAG: hypothetical protein H7Y28_00435 [Rhodoferax sp.]|nr:hypothetical protein [Rhodoferax sp.]
MFSFAKKKPVAADLQPDAVAAPSRRMGLEERMAFRREMLYQSIRDTFLSMEVIGSMYKFKVMPVDERHHRFIVMIDVAKSFVTSRQNKTKSFAAIEQMMRVDAYKRFGVLINGTYWRVSETESQFEFHARATDPSDSNAVSARSLVGGQKAPDRSRIASISGPHYEPISEEETRAFMQALKEGYAPPPLQVGDMEYQSDLAPLDDGVMIGGTQYGRLS